MRHLKLELQINEDAALSDVLGTVTEMLNTGRDVAQVITDSFSGHWTMSTVPPASTDIAELRREVAELGTFAGVHIPTDAVEKVASETLRLVNEGTLKTSDDVHSYVMAWIVADQDGPPPATGAWSVVEHDPGMPFSETDRRRSGFNMVPCPLEEAQNAAGSVNDDDIYLCLPSIEEAFRVAIENHPGGDMAAYILDHGGDTYTVIC